MSVSSQAPVPSRPTPGPPCRHRGRLLLGLLALVVGCNSISLNLLRRDPPPDRADTAADLQPGAPRQFSFRVPPFLFLSDFEIKRDQPLFAELAGLRDQVYKELQLPPGTAVVQVYLFEDRDRYERFMQVRYPDLPRRRAFFVAQPRGLAGEESLLVYTFWGSRIQQDLRHELTHALLHSVLREVPLWLDEGLAEYYELPAENRGVNATHVAHLRQGGFTPNLARLESLKEVGQMGPPEYREAWAWVHLLLKSRPEAKAALVAYLRELRGGGSPPPLGPRLAAVFAEPENALEAHLVQLEAALRSTARAER
jgi:hypothetical protein